MSMRDEFDLTPRERQVVELLLQAYSNREMARELKMSERTVKQYMNRMFNRFQIRGGIKRVKLAVLFYGIQKAGEVNEHR